MELHSFYKLVYLTISIDVDALGVNHRYLSIIGGLPMMFGMNGGQVLGELIMPP